MSAPMGVPTQRLGTSKSSSSKRQGPVAISKPSKIQQRNTGPIRTHSEASSPKIAVVAGVLRRSSTSVAASPVASGDDVQKEKADISSVGLRKIATNSRIKKDEQNKRDMYLAFINNALKSKLEGNTAPYEELVGQFTSSTSNPSDYSQLRRWLIALQHVVSQLGQRQASLVEAIVHMPWTTSPEESFVRSYVEFIGMLVTARAEWRGIVVASVARRLTHHSSLNASSVTLPSSSSAPPVTLRTIFARTHLLLQSLLALVPTLLPTLPAHFLRCFPHKSHSVVSHNVYCRNLVEVMGYCPQIVEPILALIVERAVGIDVEIQIELEELEDLATNGEGASGDAKEATGLLTNFDPFDTLAGQESESDSEDEGDENGLNGTGEIENFSDVSSEGEADDEDDTKDQAGNGVLSTKEAEKRTKRVRDMVTKLDGIMNVLLKWLAQTASPLPQQHPHFLTLLSIFDRTILTTFKSRYTQFLLFYLVSLPSFPTAIKPSNKAESSKEASTAQNGHDLNTPNPHADYFLGLLLHNTLVPQPVPIPVLTRMASASYLASFVSRALCVGQSDCRQAMILCCQWTDGRLGELEGLLLGSAELDSDSDARAELSVFYAVVQAIFLIFCFRWRDLLETADENEDDGEEQTETKRKWLNELRVVQRLIVSPLNPLKVCSPNVVHQFSRISQSVGFVYCQSIIESNRRATNFTKSSATTPTTPINATAPIWSAAVASASAAMADLQAFFPFDPYGLPQSSRWIEGMYRDWSMVALDDDDEDDDDEADSDDEEEESAVSAALGVSKSATREKTLSDAEDSTESETSEAEDAEDEASYGVPMELGSTRDRTKLGVSESFGKMSISPVSVGLHRRFKGDDSS